jgi:hypothetical protein
VAPFHTALTALAGLSVSGIQHNYDVAAVPDTLSRAQLPALLVLPGEVDDRRMFRERGQGFYALAFSGSARTVTYAVTHLLLVAAKTDGLGLRSHFPRLVDLIDAYFVALGADVTLGGTLLEPPKVTVEPGNFTHGDAAYHGCALRHLWTIEL